MSYRYFHRFISFFNHSTYSIGLIYCNYSLADRLFNWIVWYILVCFFYFKQYKNGHFVQACEYLYMLTKVINQKLWVKLSNAQVSSSLHSLKISAPFLTPSQWRRNRYLILVSIYWGFLYFEGHCLPFTPSMNMSQSWGYSGALSYSCKGRCPLHIAHPSPVKE